MAVKFGERQGFAVVHKSFCLSESQVIHLKSDPTLAWFPSYYEDRK